MARTREATRAMLDAFIARAAADAKATEDAATTSGGGACTPLVRQEIKGGRLGRHLTRLLRHQGEQDGLVFEPDGYTTLESLLGLGIMRNSGITAGQVLETVKEEAAVGKQRMSVVEREGCLWIRANQGHSIAAIQPSRLLTPITSPDEVCSLQLRESGPET